MVQYRSSILVQYFNLEKMPQVENPAVTRLREYLRIPSVHPNINYDECVKYLKKLGEDVGLSVRVIEISPNNPLVLMTYPGTNPKLPSIMFSSHMDVVPVFREKWTHEPFGAEKDENGVIYARGSQDMKTVGIQHLEAVRRLIAGNIKLPATIHITFVPDEELGGTEGSKKWVHMEEYKKLNVGCLFDESGASPTPKYIVNLSERTNYTFTIKCPGKEGHGAELMPDTAAEKMRTVINRLLEFRDKEKAKLPSENYIFFLGNVTTLNLTMLSGGMQANVVPPEFSATFDCRISPNEDPEKFEEFLNEVCKEAGKDVYVEYQTREKRTPITRQDDSNAYWKVFKESCEKMNIDVEVMVCPGNTDARFHREVGVHAFGFTALNNTPLRIHGHDECVNENTFLKGIDIYYQIMLGVAAVK